MNSIRCRQCEHYIEANVGEGKIYGCDRSKCVFEPATMSREEALKWLKEFKHMYWDGMPEEALDVAIEALEELTTKNDKVDCEHTDCKNCVNHKYCDYEPTTKNDLGVDCISRADAIQAMQDTAKKLTNEDTINGLCGAVAILFDLPSVTLQPCEDAISRKEVLNQIFYSTDNSGDVVLGSELRSRIERLPSVTPQEPRWIPLTKRPMTDEEREYYREWSDVEEGSMILNCPLPEDGQEVLVSYGGYVCTDTFCKDDGCYFEGVDIDDVDAWQPLPQPYREVEK
jgi:hypothetical protein